MIYYVGSEADYKRAIAMLWILTPSWRPGNEIDAKMDVILSAIETYKVNCKPTLHFGQYSLI